jgi:TfoX/Sxy family transcriptional regulator of competence genes
LALAERLRRVLSGRKGVEEKTMFGGIGFLLSGNMLVGVWKDALIARLGPEQAEAALQRSDVGPMDITGTPMKGWVLIRPDGIEDDESLRKWVEQAVAFVGGLPAKRPGSKVMGKTGKGKRKPKA